MPAYDLRRGYGDRHVLLFVSDAAACNYAKGVTPRGVSVEVWERTMRARCRLGTRWANV
jgi:hypothetical protein